MGFQIRIMTPFQKQSLIICTVIVIVIVSIIILIYRKKLNETSNVEEVFDTKSIQIEDLIQIQELYSLKSLKEFRTYNPSIFTIENVEKFEHNKNKPYFVFRMGNFTNCKNIFLKRWNENELDTIESYTFILTPENEILKISHPDVSITGCEKGCEDGRSFIHKKRLWMTFSSKSGENCKAEMYLMSFDLDELDYRKDGQNRKLKTTKPAFSNHRTLVNEIEPDRFFRLKYATKEDKGAHQKNWMPFIYQNELYLVYSVNPHIILKCHIDEHDDSKNQLIKVAETHNKNIREDYRGGSQIIYAKKWNRRSRPVSNNKFSIEEQDKYEAEELFVGIVHVRENQSHRYLTYFYAFECIPPFKIKYITDEFIFGKDGEHLKRIQFVSGLARIYENDIPYYYITYGQDDCDSKLCKIREDTILHFLKPVTKR
jgi:hypothetical protein